MRTAASVRIQIQTKIKAAQAQVEPPSRFTPTTYRVLDHLACMFTYEHLCPTNWFQGLCVVVPASSIHPLVYHRFCWILCQKAGAQVMVQREQTSPRTFIRSTRAKCQGGQSWRTNRHLSSAVFPIAGRRHSRRFSREVLGEEETCVLLTDDPFSELWLLKVAELWVLPPADFPSLRHE